MENTIEETTVVVEEVVVATEKEKPKTRMFHGDTKKMLNKIEKKNLGLKDIIEEVFEVKYNKEMRDSLYSFLGLIGDKYGLAGSKYRNDLAIEGLKKALVGNIGKWNKIFSIITKLDK